MMLLERFRELVDAYGGDPRRWPLTERGPAAELLAASAEARAVLAEAAALDQLLDRAPPTAPATLDAERLIARATAAGQERPFVPLAGVMRPTGRRLWLRAASLAAATIIGFVVGWTQLADTSEATAASGSSLDFAGDLSW
jgi:hypothetical protein